MGLKAQASRRHRVLSSAELRESILTFVKGCSDPVVVEPGEEPISVRPGSFSVDVHGASCLLHVWGEEGNLVRRISGFDRLERGRFDLRARTFAKGEITLSLLDRARRGPALGRESVQVRFREHFRRLLRREFADWNIESLTCSPDLEHSLSPLYTRGVITAGQQAWAVMGASAEIDPQSCDSTLTFGLIWLDFLRRRERRRVFRGLRIFLPESQTASTANRLTYLNRNFLQCELYSINRRGEIQKLDAADHGNLATELRPCFALPEAVEPVAGWVRQLELVPGVESVARADGLLSLRVRGVPFATAGRSVLVAGMDRQEPVTEHSFTRVLRLAQELGRFRSAEAEDRQIPLYRRHPESWLESQVRSHLPVIDEGLLPQPVYSHVLASAGTQRGVIDLLACGRRGRISLLELKASEDIHLPMQALDYWIRVHWHLRRENFARGGYFPGVEVRKSPPRLILVSPAFEFHPTTETILRCFSPQIEIERVGVGAEWRRELKVVFRKKGPERIA